MDPSLSIDYIICNSAKEYPHSTLEIWLLARDSRAILHTLITFAIDINLKKEHAPWDNAKQSPKPSSNWSKS